MNKNKNKKLHEVNFLLANKHERETSEKSVSRKTCLVDF